MHMTRVDVDLGHEWLHGLGPSLKCSCLHNTLTFDAHGAHIFLMGEQDALTSPLNCDGELHAIINNNEINILSLCYLMPSSLDSIVCVSEVSKVKTFYATSSCTSLSKSNPPKQYYESDKDNEQLQLLYDNFCDVSPNDLPSRLTLERTIMHGVDLLLDSKPISQYAQ